MTRIGNMESQHAGVLAALGAFLMWGFSPLFYRAIGAAPALEILAHRAAWSLLLTLALVSISGRGRELRRLLGQPRRIGALLLSSILVAINWFGFIWAVNNGRALEASMGYFIFPIVMVLLGRLFLDERLTRAQLIALLLVVAGVLNQLLMQGSPPWIALILAVSFSLYGLVRKKIPVDALVGLTLECLLLFPLAALYLIWLDRQGQLVFGSAGLLLDILLACSALMTALPLLLFTGATRRLRLGTVGLLQYINPTCQFALAVWLFGEPFTHSHLITFLFIWCGLALFTLDARRRQQRSGV